MTKTLFLHLGTGKTGSTHLQSTFDLNEDLLRARGLSYARSGRTKINHHLLSRNFRRRIGDKDALIGPALADLAREIASDPNDYFLASSEYFPGTTADEISELRSTLAGVDVVPVVYVRRQDELLESWYAQMIKAKAFGYDIRRQRAMLEAAGSFDYSALADRWARVNAAGRVVVRPYETASFAGGSLLSDFFAALDWPSDPDLLAALEPPATASNPSIRPDQIRVAVTLRDYCDERQRKVLVRHYPELRDRSRYFLPAAERRALVADWDAGNRRVAERYLGRQRLFLDDAYPEAVTTGGQFAFLRHFVLTLLLHHPRRADRVREPIARYLDDVEAGDDRRAARAAAALAKVVRNPDPARIRRMARRAAPRS